MTSIQVQALEPLLTAEELGAVFRVDPATVCRWAREGRLSSVPTPGGKLRRFRQADVRALLTAEAVSC